MFTINHEQIFEENNEQSSFLLSNQIPCTTIKSLIYKKKMFAKLRDHYFFCFKKKMFEIIPPIPEIKIIRTTSRETRKSDLTYTFLFFCFIIIFVLDNIFNFSSIKK